ncbi:hypothetical protein PIROE2DRAFT_20390 [Piromyces sp. E2]|nr:hypothetical protein PIROE2DRAFT_20390 [Piromyces sp. E2]|eukprot:OUM65096.1 hypothetical protein PIROE2DRAFT_20390 [Piromyces sp. E2]
MNCRDGGVETYQAKNADGSIYGPDFLMKSFYNQDEQEREKAIADFCQKVPSTLAFFEELFKSCSQPYSSFQLSGQASHSSELNYKFTKFYQSYYCSTDATTGESCYKIFKKPEDLLEVRDDLIGTPYGEWDPQYCKSTSCLAQLDAGLNEYRNYEYKYVSIGPLDDYHSPFNGNNHKWNDNSYKCCGMDDGTIGAKEKCKADTNDTNDIHSGNSTSDATTLSAQITLLSFIVCLIFALFK